MEAARGKRRRPLAMRHKKETRSFVRTGEAQRTRGRASASRLHEAQTWDPTAASVGEERSDGTFCSGDVTTRPGEKYSCC